MTNKVLLDRIKKFIDDELSQIIYEGYPININGGACYTASKIGAEILKGLGFFCSIERVEVWAGNEIGREIFARQCKAGFYDKDEVIRNEGWIIGIGVPPDTFHYVIYFPNEKEIMDLTYNQADRPIYNLRAEAYWAKMNNLPDTIIKLQFIAGESSEFNPLYNDLKYRRKFKKIIRRGIAILKTEGYERLEEDEEREFKFRRK